LEIGTSGRGENIRKECRRVNMVNILHTHVWKQKSETCWNYSRNERSGVKKMMEGVHSTMIYYKNFCKCPNVSPAQKGKKKTIEFYFKCTWNILWFFVLIIHLFKCAYIVWVISPHCPPSTSSGPSRSCSVLITNFVEEKT
jgi:hypothetical protein